MTTMAKRRNDKDPQLMCPLALSQHAPSTSKRPIPSSTFKKGNTIDTVLLPRPNRSTRERHHLASQPTSMCHQNLEVDIINRFMILANSLNNGDRNNSLTATSEEPTYTTER
jgi:hypothetical protein